jgi:hypothetical protein
MGREAFVAGPNEMKTHESHKNFAVEVELEMAKA